MSPANQRVSGSKTPFVQRMMNFFRVYKRDVFFSCVALMAVGTVVGRELKVHGVVPLPTPIEVVPKVEREFGSRRHRAE